eukprot:8916510-Pyramimonas_sp.AAC.1
MQARGIAALSSEQWVEPHDRVTPTDWHAKQNNHNMAMMTIHDSVITLSVIPVSASTPNGRDGLSGLYTGPGGLSGSQVPREDDG